MKKVIFISIILLTLTGCTININNYDSNNSNEKENEVVENTSNENNDITKEEVKEENNTSINNNVSSNNYNTNTNDNTSDNNSNNSISNNDELVDTSNIKSEEDVVNYFVKLKEKIIEISKSDTWQNVKGKVISALETAYGFCFKGEEIGGFTLKELSTSAKEKILNIVFDIDSYLEGVSPGYKDMFSESYHNLINSTKESLGLIKDKISDIFEKDDE